LRPLAPRARIEALADPGSARPVDASFDAPRPSPHLARWRIAAQDDDGIVISRAVVHGAPVMIAAQDERFLRGSAGANHGEALRRLFECAGVERPAAVVILAASAGVRLHEANPAEWALARAVAALLDLRAAGVPVLALCVADTFGGASVLACAAERIALLPGTRFGLSGPAVIEVARGRGEVDAGDVHAIAALFGAEARAASGHVEIVADDVETVRGWIAMAVRGLIPFEVCVRTMQARLGARLASAGPPDAQPATPHAVQFLPSPPALPDALKTLYADAQKVDPPGWLWRMRDRPLWLTRAMGVAPLGPSEVHALDAALLAGLAGGDAASISVLIHVGDSSGHEASRNAESLCISQYLAQHAAVLALLRSRGVRIRGLLTTLGHSAAFFATALQADEVYALSSARVVAMDPAAIARVLRLPEQEIAALVESDPLVGQPIANFARWGGITAILSGADPARLRSLAELDLPLR
jgi:malonate decarboxylase beta subunit